MYVSFTQHNEEESIRHAHLFSSQHSNQLRMKVTSYWTFFMMPSCILMREIWAARYLVPLNTSFTALIGCCFHLHSWSSLFKISAAIRHKCKQIYPRGFSLHLWRYFSYRIRFGLFDYVWMSVCPPPPEVLHGNHGAFTLCNLNQRLLLSIMLYSYTYEFQTPPS